MARESMTEMLHGVTVDNEPRPKLLSNNTVQYYQNGCKIVRLHHTDIIKWSADGKTCKLYTDGWKTSTTKDRLNSYMPGRGSIFTHKGIWYIAPGVVFVEGVELTTAGVIVECDRAAKRAVREGVRQNALAKRIHNFTKRIHDLDELPKPCAGDCWLCSMFYPEPSGTSDYTDRPKQKDVSHLESHIDEGYLHGSLIVNAMRWAGRTDIAIAMAYDNHARDKAKGCYNGRDSWAARDLRRYLRSQLGTGA